MEFNQTAAAFSKKDHFTDTMKRFVSEEAAIFTPEGEEAASASFDRTAEKLVRFSADKHKANIKEQKAILIEIHAKQEKVEEILEIKKASDKETKQETSKSSESKESGKEQAKAEKKELSSAEKSANKTKSKETRKAAAKTAVANLLKGKADIGNSLVSDKSTGDALKDGNTGLVKTFTTLINPMTYIKKWLASLGAMIAPYILIFVSVAAVVLIVISLLFSVLQPIAEVGEALQNFIGFFTGEDGGLRNTAFTADEIDEIVANSGATDERETVIRYALSKVGYPYSQAQRTSGSAYDCSSLAYYSWNDAGVDISYGTGYPPTAAEGAKQLENHGKKLSTFDLKPGDLVYYGGNANGRYMGIYHVAIYVGNGMAVEALNEDYGVVYQKLRTNKACMVCRPNM